MKRHRPAAGQGSSAWLALLAIPLFSFGLALFFYPTVSNWLAQKNQASVIQAYQTAVDANDADTLAAEWAAAEAYNENLAGDPVHDPFVLGSGYALPEDYLDVLNINGVMGYLDIPKISLYLPIYHGTNEAVLEQGVGHIEATSLPIGGRTRHAVLTGHRGLPSAELFTNLDQLEFGDLFYIHVLDQVLAYEVDQILTVNPDQLDSLVAVEGEDYITLVTCTPYGVNTHRMLVRGSRTNYIAEEQTATPTVYLPISGSELARQAVGILLGGILLALVLSVFLLMRRRAEKPQGGKRGHE